MSKKKSIIIELLRNILIILLVALVVGLFVFDNKLTFALGLLVGGGVTIIKLIMMEDTIKKAVMKPPHAASSYIRAHYILRYVISFLVLFIAVITPSIDVIGVGIGLFVMKPAAYLQGKLEPLVPKDGTVEFLEWEDEDEDEKSDFW